MLNFIFHPSFEKESAKLKKRFVYFNDGLESFQRLCEVQFNPINPIQVIVPAKIHRVSQSDLWTLWKVELAVKGLRPNQSLRVWFAVKGADGAFLCACTHIDNYSDNDMNKTAMERVPSIF